MPLKSKDDLFLNTANMILGGNFNFLTRRQTRFFEKLSFIFQIYIRVFYNLDSSARELIFLQAELVYFL